MRTLAVFALIMSALAPFMARSDATEDATYEVYQLQRVNRAIEILTASGSKLEDYDVVFYERKDAYYLITFTNDVVFAEDGPIRGPDVRMLFNAETDALIGVEVVPLQDR